MNIADRAVKHNSDKQMPKLIIRCRHYGLIKQKVPFYLFYLLLTPTQLTVNEDSFPIGYVLGPGLAAGNMAVASTANSRLKKELTDFDLFGKTIKPGQTLYGLIGIPEGGFLPLRVVVSP